MTAPDQTRDHRAGQLSEPRPCALRDLYVYFLRLGTTGFGGPIALVGHMQRDLVERRGWFTVCRRARGAP